MKALAGSISALKVKYADVELALDVEPEHGLADSGDLDTDLADLLTATAEAAAERGAAVVLSVDELQYVPEDQLAALIMALHTANQARLTVTMLAAGSPQLLRAMRRAKSYAERLFEFVPIDRLNDAAAAHALQLPPGAKAWSSPTRRSASCSSRAGATPTSSSNGASRSETSPTPLRSVATRLDERSTKSWPISTQRLPSALRQTHPGREDLHARDGRAWAGPHRFGEIADRLGRKVTIVAPIRNALTEKGMIFSPAPGETAFTAPSSTASCCGSWPRHDVRRSRDASAGVRLDARRRFSHTLKSCGGLGSALSAGGWLPT